MSSHDGSSGTGRRMPYQTAFADAYQDVLSDMLGQAGSRNLLPLVYALRHNDIQLARALLGFARERALTVADADAALAVLELAEGALSGQVQKDVCARVASNLLDEAYEQLLADRRFDRYFSAICASSAARLAMHVQEPASLDDATEVIRAAASLARMSSPKTDSRQSVTRTIERAHEYIREAVSKRQRPQA